MSISPELTVLSFSAGNDRTRMQRTRYQTGAPLQGDLRSIFMISSDYGPFQFLIEYLNLLSWRCEACKANLFRYSQAVFWLVLYFIRMTHELLTICCYCWVTEESFCGEGSRAYSGSIEAYFGSSVVSGSCVSFMIKCLQMILC